jgi:hypothetical protein
MDCPNAADQADQRRQVLALLPANLSSGSTVLHTNSTLDLSSESGVVVVDYAGLRLKSSVTLTIQGNASIDAVIVRVAGDLRVGSRGRVITQGISVGPNGSPAERVLFLVTGTATLGKGAELEGTVFSQGRLAVSRSSRITGALITANPTLRLGREVQVDHKPWVLW